MTIAEPHPAAAASSGNGMDDEELRAVAAAAAPLFERLDGAYEPVGTADDVAPARLAEWRRAVAGDDPERFRRRLAWDGLDEARVLPVLGSVRLRDGVPLPAWADDLRVMLAAGDADTAPAFVDADAPIAFQDALAPFVTAASAKVQERVDFGGFTSEARGRVERALLQRLFTVAGPVLLQEFNIFRHPRLSALDRLFQVATGRIGREVYAAFVAELRAGGWRALLVRHPVLARLMSVVWRHWIDATVEMVERLRADAPALETAFGARGAVTGVHTGLSDAHRGGRSVSILTFSSGARVVYKPRDVAGERVWAELLAAFQDAAPAGGLRPAQVIDRGGYGWMECVESATCDTQAEADAYHERLGILLALTYALGTNDCHYENLVASGAHPVLVDLETLLHPVVDPRLPGAPSRVRLDESVLRTGFLPYWMGTEAGLAFDVSGLGAVDAQPSRRPVPEWRRPNTDLMELALEHREREPGPNAPTLRGQPLLPEHFQDAISRGFRAGYHAAAERLPALLPRLEPLRVRMVIRPTYAYYLAMQAAATPDALRDGVLRSIRLDGLVGDYLAFDAPPANWPALAAERIALEVQDAPHFTAAATDAALETELGPLDGVILRPALDDVRARLARMGADDLGVQVGTVLASLDTRTEMESHAPSTAPASGSVAVPPLSGDELLAQALEIGAALRRAAIRGVDGTPYWLSLRRNAALGKFRIEVSGPDLFEGRAGIALFFAALARATGDAEARSTATELLHALAAEVDAVAAAPDRLGVPQHGLAGMAGLAYALPRAAGLLNAPALAHAPVERLLDVLEPASLLDSRSFDLIGGGAGTLLSLLGAGDRALPFAAACGDALLEGRVRMADGRRAWPTLENRVLTGLAHGTAGIALALARLGRATGHARFTAAAVEAAAYEDALYDDGAGNWPDLRWDPHTFADGWCHGGPGIALARLDPPDDAAAAPRWRTDAARGLRVAAGAPLGRLDHLCCGNLGRALCLVEGGRRLGLDGAVAAGEALAAAVVARARREGGYGLWRRYDGFLAFPGLFQGLAGVGYAFLRIAAPGDVPNVLTLE
ncbi:type 2 lanthipeptide synthetase LanM [Longimicrobium terrae]|uniref:Type 2 lantibiotic biosynthesis protein LanM n=1 Tax=Longimicrobium terrae TaxID=1639882 RepID=A0A841H792_9BACT|nr:type 2 lanthipeptide synthetase LanM [Longimicrobium terrae]MBB4639441.1 type 2 lantibiotic biosynthesis protein LanM [Longimicrobium terrae]MBB6073813.1 type 2 lantibiotic biosynthesis protein LanM [Longimicrobium terrae]NNC33201.1 type 2 lantipeptide synthetase LanM [Longimicrobium terrae]